MSLISVYLVAGLVIWSMGLLLWLASLAFKDASIVDPFWSLFFLAVVLTGFWAGGWSLGTRQLLLLVIVGCWSLRLAGFLARRNWGKGEDFRYRAWRENGGASWWWVSYFKVFLLQGALAWIISIPLLAVTCVSGFGGSPNWLDGLGLVLWLLGFCFEAIGDYQLQRHRRDPGKRGTVLNTGLWRYTRHPNYFGEAVLWWGFYCLALASGAWWTLYAPLLMTFLLLKVSGVALLERSLTRGRPDYEAYKRTTPAFFPWFPRTGEKSGGRH